MIGIMGGGFDDEGNRGYDHMTNDYRNVTKHSDMGDKIWLWIDGHKHVWRGEMQVEAFRYALQEAHYYPMFELYAPNMHDNEHFITLWWQGRELWLHDDEHHPLGSMRVVMLGGMPYDFGYRIIIEDDDPHDHVVIVDDNKEGSGGSGHTPPSDGTIEEHKNKNENLNEDDAADLLLRNNVRNYIQRLADWWNGEGDYDLSFDWWRWDFKQKGLGKKTTQHRLWEGVKGVLFGTENKDTHMEGDGRGGYKWVPDIPSPFLTAVKKVLQSPDLWSSFALKYVENVISEGLIGTAPIKPQLWTPKKHRYETKKSFSQRRMPWVRHHRTRLHYHNTRLLPRYRQRVQNAWNFRGYGRIARGFTNRYSYTRSRTRRRQGYRTFRSRSLYYT